MGFNSTVLIYNDHLASIEEDKNFGRNISNAIQKVTYSNHSRINTNNGYAGIVLETHHSRSIVPVLVGRNMGQVIRDCNLTDYDNVELFLLKELANKNGYRLVKKK